MRIAVVELALATLTLATLTACGGDNGSSNKNAPLVGGGTAYVDQTPQPQPSPSTNQPQIPAEALTAPAAPPQEQKELKMPEFYDVAKGEIKDLPRFPRSSVTNIQIGPVDGTDMAVLYLEAHEEFDQVVRFYEAAIKNNKWSVLGNSRDPGNDTWRLNKGVRDQATVQVKLDPLTKRVFVVLSRYKMPLESAPK